MGQNSITSISAVMTGGHFGWSIKKNIRDHVRGLRVHLPASVMTVAKELQWESRKSGS
jgi:hypothetical protein